MAIQTHEEQEQAQLALEAAGPSWIIVPAEELAAAQAAENTDAIEFREIRGVSKFVLRRRNFAVNAAPLTTYSRA